jgi:hypothetical protein
MISMDRVRGTVFCLAVLLAGLVVVLSPMVAAAAPQGAAHNYQGDSGGTDTDERNFISVPGVFSLRLGPGGSTPSGGFSLRNPQIDLPALNATATVEGLTVNVREGSYGWDAVTVMQSKPAGNDSVTISGTQARVQGQALNYSTELSTRVDFHPNASTQAGANITVSYDGVTGQPSFALADGSAELTAGPATVSVEGLNAGDGAFSVDSAQVMLAEADTGVRVDGFTVADGSATWEALAWYGREFNLGDAVTLSDNLVVIPGPGSENAGAGGATTTFAIKAGDLAQIDGQLILARDPATGQPALVLRNGSAVLGTAAWSLAASGVNVGPQGATVDTVQMTLAPLNLQAQVSGVAVSGDSGMTFDQARVRYLPDPAAGATAIGGFELVIDSTEAGYIVTTTTLVPAATASSQP